MNKYLEILNKLHERSDVSQDDHIVLIDSLNTFIRNFTTLKSMNPGGHHVGGLLGFLRSLGFLVRILDPTRVICIFDGKGSSINRKNVDSNYKANRDTVRITNWGLFDTKAEEKESMSAQINRLMDYLETLPVGVLMYDKIEADDIISFIAQEKANKGSKITIISSDRDFLQIINKNISVYAPILKKTFTHENIESHLGLHPSNYLIAKALIGDLSDNLQGVKGLGKKSVNKLFPELVENPNRDLKYVYEVCEQNIKSTKKIFAKIINDWDKVERNYDLMNIQNPRLTDEEKDLILDDISKQRYLLNTGAFQRYLDQDKIEGITSSTDIWLEQFRSLTLFKNSYDNTEQTGTIR